MEESIELDSGEGLDRYPKFGSQYTKITLN